MMGNARQMQARQQALRDQIFREARQRREAGEKRIIAIVKEVEGGVWKPHECWSCGDIELIREKYHETRDIKFAKLHDKMIALAKSKEDAQIAEGN